MKRIAVLGGGVTGVVLAKHLADRGAFMVDLIEKEERLGGLHRSVRLEDFVFDIGAFQFSRQHELLRSFPCLAGRFVPVRAPSLSVTPCGNVCQYPITVRSYLRDNGALRSIVAALDLLVSRIRYHERNTVPSFAKYHMGGQIYRRSGLQHYIERLYGIKDEEIDLEFALQRLHAIRKYGPVALARRQLRALLRLFASASSSRRPALVRPPEGFEEVYREIAASLTTQGVAVRTGCTIKMVTRTADAGYEIDFGDHKEWYHRVVSTIPVPAMLRLLGTSPRVRFEHAALLSLFYRGRIRHDAAFLYNFTRRGYWKRITVLSSLYGAVNGSDYFTVEVTTQDTSLQHLEALRVDFETHAALLSLRMPDVPLQCVGSILTERAYPLFRRGKTSELQAERDRLTAAGIDFVGRQGNFAYLSSHDAAQQAATLAATIE